MLRVNVMPTNCDDCLVRAQELKGTDVRAVDWSRAEELVIDGKLTSKEVFSICCCHSCAEALSDLAISGKEYWAAREKKEQFDSCLIEIRLRKMREKMLGDL